MSETRETLTNYQYNLLFLTLHYYYFTTLSIRRNVATSIINISSPSLPPNLLSTTSPTFNDYESTSILSRFLSSLPIATQSLSPTEIILLSLSDLLLSRSLLHILPFPELNSLNLSTLLSPFNLHSVLPISLPSILKKQRKETVFWKGIIAVGLMGLIQELSHLGIIWAFGTESWRKSVSASRSGRRERDRIGRKRSGGQKSEGDEQEEKNWGIEIRGGSIPSSYEDGEVEGEKECAICLRSTSSSPNAPSLSPPQRTSKNDDDDNDEKEEEEDPLELFCTSCSTLIHRSCLLQWWDTVQFSLYPSSSSTSSSRQIATSNLEAENRVDAGGEEVRTEMYQINIGGTLMWTTFRVSSNSNTRQSNPLPPSSTNTQTPDSISTQTNVWGLGPLTQLYSGEVQDSTTTLPTTISVSNKFIKFRSELEQSQNWYEPFPSEEILRKVRNKFYENSSAREEWEEIDPMIAVVDSVRPGPSCPNCRSSIRLRIYLVSRDSTRTPSTTTSSHPSNLSRIKAVKDFLVKRFKLIEILEVISRFWRFWKLRMGIWSLTEKLFVACIVRGGLRGLCGVISE